MTSLMSDMSRAACADPDACCGSLCLHARTLQKLDVAKLSRVHHTRPRMASSSRRSFSAVTSTNPAQAPGRGQSAEARRRLRALIDVKRAAAIAQEVGPRPSAIIYSVRLGAVLCCALGIQPECPARKRFMLALYALHRTDMVQQQKSKA